MRLKTLEIKGFKSFADKTILHFNNNMTGVIGPNGCGKSNTIDAIRWVLGEQKSKALRLEKMDNILFNGTKKRKPSGRAEVALTFENTKNLLPTEFTSVTVQRILYRTGDSEYRLNGVKCRLKDITNLFMDTGISSDSYAIIELKMIDEILNDKENSRRKLFEQAAGISKYKKRKKQTLQKLTATDGDLDRVEDLLFEIEKNLKSLERQAKRTKRYYEIKEEYKILSIDLALHQIGEQKGTLKSVKEKMKAEKDHKMVVETNIKILEAEIEDKKAKIITEEKRLAIFQKDLNDLMAKLRERESSKKLLEQNKQFLTEKTNNLEKQMYSVSETLELLKQEVERLKWDKKGEEEEREKLIEKVKDQELYVEEVKKEHREKRQGLDKLQAEARKGERTIFELEKKIAVKSSQSSNLKREIRDNKRRFEARQAELVALQKNMTAAEQAHQNAKVQLENLVTEEKNIRQQINETQQLFETLRQQLTDGNRKLDAKRTEFRLTKSLVDSLEGFPDSIKFLKKNKTQWNKNSPLLLDIINCEDEYKVAIENYLKDYLNYYVVGDVEEAIAAIHLLDRKNKGKANFFIAKDFENQSENKVVESLENAVSAAKIMRVDTKYENLIYHLLKKVYLIDNEYVVAQKDLQNGFVFITKDGKKIRQKASLTGGSVGAYEGKRIGKRQQLQQLETEIEELGNEMKVLDKQMNEQRNSLRFLQNDLRNKAKSLQKQNSIANNSQNRMMGFQMKIENSQNVVTETETKELSLNERIAVLENEMQMLTAELNDIKADRQLKIDKVRAAERNFRDISRRLTQVSQNFNEQKINFHKQENRIQSISQNLSFKEKQLTDKTQQSETNSVELAATKLKITTLTAEIVELGEILKVFYRKKDKKEEALTEAETLYYAVRGKVDVVEKKWREKGKQKEQIEVIIQAFNNKLNELNLQLLSIKERLNIEFEVNIDDIMDNEPSDKLTMEQLAEKVQKIRKRLSKYGDINPLAVEAYNEIKERYDFIIVQRNDLLDAKNSLLKTIKEIEGTATDKFMDAFNKVRTNFIEVFRSLFTDEDQCDLVLMDKGDPLDSKIDIIAKPKGKRPQSINQLSGGEKSLTALALVFSLYLLKPAPFCILDEVDAPLDDANVGKFTNIIRKFSEESQFIIVTHNKNTMASADVIYGVTMQEAGVSSVVPVDFNTLVKSKAF